LIFKQVQEIINQLLPVEQRQGGTKGQTRRICKDGETAVYDDAGEIVKVLDARGRVKWEVGNDRCVQPKRGSSGLWYTPCCTCGGVITALANAIVEDRYMPDSPEGEKNGWNPLRIKIVTIGREPVNKISTNDAVAEGYPYEFPPTGPVNHPHQADPRGWYADLWDSINKRKGQRFADAPECWCLTFEVVK
jgi:hypothetical protein